MLMSDGAASGSNERHGPVLGEMAHNLWAQTLFGEN
jgi:hypothetical protein